MDIRDFYRSTQENSTNQDFTNENSSNNFQNENTNEKNTNSFNEYAETINKYKDLSQQDLYSELLKQASNLKAQGKLNQDTLEKLSSTLAPMLNDEQQQLLSNIIERLK